MNKTKRRIFNTAIRVFSEKGYDNASVEEITAIAGVAKGSLYYHFSKKEDDLLNRMEIESDPELTTALFLTYSAIYLNIKPYLEEKNNE